MARRVGLTVKVSGYPWLAMSGRRVRQRNGSCKIWCGAEIEVGSGVLVLRRLVSQWWQGKDVDTLIYPEHTVPDLAGVMLYRDSGDVRNKPKRARSAPSRTIFGNGEAGKGIDDKRQVLYQYPVDRHYLDTTRALCLDHLIGILATGSPRLASHLREREMHGVGTAGRDAEDGGGACGR
jgi:hypothetical protein